MTRGTASPNYGTHRSVMRSGYVRIWRPGHSLANRDGYVLEHRLVLHEAGIKIPEGHHVHHLNGDKADNRIENLEVLAAGDHHHGHVQAAGEVTNQFGTWPLHTPETRRAYWRDKQRKRRAS